MVDESSRWRRLHALQHAPVQLRHSNRRVCGAERRLIERLGQRATPSTDEEMERLANCRGSVASEEELHGSGEPACFNDPSADSSKSAAATEVSFPHQQHHGQIGYNRDKDQSAPSYSSQQTFGMDSLRAASESSYSPQPEYHHHHHHHHHRCHQLPQHQLFHGRHYFINDLLSATAASSSVLPPDPPVASSIQLLNGN